MFGIKSTDVSLKEVRCFHFPNHAIFSFSEKDVVNPDVQYPFACLLLFVETCINLFVLIEELSLCLKKKD